MLLALAIVILAILVVKLPMNDISKRTPWDVFRDWYRKYPKYRIMEKVRESDGINRYEAQMRLAFWPLWWIDLNPYYYYDDMSAAKDRIDREKTERARKSTPKKYYSVD